MSEAPSTEAMRDAHCWFAVDRVAGEPATTAWKRDARWRQAKWREAQGHPIGRHPHSGGPDAKLVGSRLDLPFAKASGANFIGPGPLAAARARAATPEPHQMLAEDRLWADLFSSMPLCFNLFGDLASDPARAANAVRLWWPDAPHGTVTTRFEHSPGRRDRTFLGNRSAFDVAFEIAMADGSRGILGVETKYHEHAKPESAPKPAALARYVEVTERSRVFLDGWRERVLGTELQQLWQDHLLVLAMLQHPSRKWAWGRFVLVYPEKNPSFARAAAQYGALLKDAATFEARTIESLVGAAGALDEATVAAFRGRYL